MNLDELQSVQARERQSSDLQHLRSSFYREVGEFIEELDAKRARLVEEADDPFSDPEIRRITDDIETAEGTVEAIYERRVGKVVKKASIAAAGMPIDDDGLTSEEEALFEDLVDRIESNRETVLSVLDGDAPSVSCSIDGEPESADGTEEQTTDGASAPSPDRDPSPGDGVSAADLMGEGGGTAEAPDEGSATSPDSETGPPPSPSGDSPAVSEPPTPRSADEEQNGGPKAGGPPTPPSDDGGSRPRPDTDPGGTSDRATGADAERAKREPPGLPRTTVRITADVGEIVGADDRDYDLGNEDVVTLPEPNADVLVEKDAAERLG